MNSNPLVSIAIPAYKSKYLRAAIEAALGQTYHKIEVIVVNDKSPETDNIISIVKSFQDERIRYYENDKNLGSKDPANNWDKCLSYAKGDYFCLLCDDDIYEPTFVEEMIALGCQFPNCNVFRSRCAIIDDAGTLLDLYPSSPLWESSEDYMLHVFNGIRRQSISEFMLRTAHVKSVGGYAHLPLAWQADYVSVISFGLSGGIASTNNALVCFRMSGQNISSRSFENGFKKIESNLIAYRIFKELIQKTSNKALFPILINSIDTWKYRVDSDLIKFMNVKQYFKLLFNLRKYGISKKAYLKGVLLSFF